MQGGGSRGVGWDSPVGGVPQTPVLQPTISSPQAFYIPVHDLLRKQAQLRNNTFLNFLSRTFNGFLQDLQYFDDVVTISRFFNFYVFRRDIGKARNRLFWGILKTGSESAFLCLIWVNAMFKQD